MTYAASISFRSTRSSEIPTTSQLEEEEALGQQLLEEELEEGPPRKQQRLDSNSIKQLSYWDSSEAHNLFWPKEGDDSICETLERRIEILSSVNKTVEGWKNVV